MGFSTSPVLWLLAVVLVIALVWGLRAWLGFRGVREDARAEHALRVERGMAGGEATEDAFVRAYSRVHGPRAQAYAALGLGAVIALTPVLLRAADLLMNLLWRLSGNDRTFEPTFLVYQFGIFFLTILGWAAIGFVVARAFHKRTPVSLRDELIREAQR